MAPSTYLFLPEWMERPREAKEKNKGGDEPSSRGLVGGVTWRRWVFFFYWLILMEKIPPIRLENIEFDWNELNE